MSRQRPQLILPVVLAATCIVITSPASAYVGPGAGLSLLGALWGVLVVVGMTLGFLIIWPIRRYLRQRNGRTHHYPAADTASDQKPPTDTAGR